MPDIRAKVHPISSVYSRLIHLYPRTFHNQFGEEMQAVFSQAVSEAKKQEKFATASLFIRELFDLPISLIRIHWEQINQGGKMTPDNKPLNNEPAASSTTERNSPTRFIQSASWWESLVAGILFLVIPVAMNGGYWAGSLIKTFNLSEKSLHLIEQTSLWILLGFLAVMTIAGLVKGFPRWYFPYFGVAIFIIIVIILSPIDDKVENANFLLYFIYLLLPLVITGLVWLGRYWRPLHGAYEKVQKDWTLLSLASCCLMTLATAIAVDETTQEQAIELILGAMIMLGVVITMRSSNIWVQALALPITLLVVMVFSSYYITYDYGIRAWLSSSTVQLITGQGAVLLVVIGLPALLELVRRRRYTSQPLIAS